MAFVGAVSDRENARAKAIAVRDSSYNMTAAPWPALRGQPPILQNWIGARLAFVGAVSDRENTCAEAIAV
ncbi:hypothetical protein B9Z50_02115 [Limnohabitans sp. Bal53]|nr:hypothetical protein B9Z50_02115 [Limnohabitans sp. Bal53]